MPSGLSIAKLDSDQTYLVDFGFFCKSFPLYSYFLVTGHTLGWYNPHRLIIAHVNYLSNCITEHCYQYTAEFISPQTKTQCSSDALVGYAGQDHVSRQTTFHRGCTDIVHSESWWEDRRASACAVCGFPSRRTPGRTGCRGTGARGCGRVGVDPVRSSNETAFHRLGTRTASRRHEIASGSRGRRSVWMPCRIRHTGKVAGPCGSSCEPPACSGTRTFCRTRGTCKCSWYFGETSSSKAAVSGWRHPLTDRTTRLISTRIWFQAAERRGEQNRRWSRVLPS